MRNRAKCRLCNDIIESTHVHDYKTCSCGEISVDGGNEYHRCSAKDFHNFIRLDDKDNQHLIVGETKEYTCLEWKYGPTKITPPKSEQEIAIQVLISKGVTPEMYEEAYNEWRDE
jgi:hypothetical protein